MLADLPENGATGVAAALFARVRAESGSALVNFVWRHLATLSEGTADWCWDMVRQADVRSAAQALSLQADRAVATLAGPPPQLPALELQVADILDTYNRNNPMNLARMGLLLRVLDKLHVLPNTQHGTAVPQPDGPRTDVALPPLPLFSALSGDELRAIDTVSGAGPASGSGVSPSLWRHLTVQQGLMSAIAGPMAKVVSLKEFRAVHRALVDTASAPLWHPEIIKPPPDFDADRVRTSVVCFAERIAELTLAGRILANWSTTKPQESIAG